MKKVTYEGLFPEVVQFKQKFVKGEPLELEDDIAEKFVDVKHFKVDGVAPKPSEEKKEKPKKIDKEDK